MGAQFDQKIFDHKPTQKEYDDLCEQRAWDHGHSGYSGTFAEARGNVSIREAVTYGSYDEAYDYLVDACEKWEPGIAVPYKKEDETFWLVGAWCSS